MPTLAPALEADTAAAAGRSVASQPVVPAVEDDTPLLLSAPPVPELMTYPGEDTYPGSDTYPSADPPSPAVGAASLPVVPAVDTQAAFGGPTQAVAPALFAGPEIDAAGVATRVASYPTSGAADTELALPITIVTTPADLVDAITDVDRVPVLLVQADWSRGGNFDSPWGDLSSLVEEVTLSRELVGALPPEIGLVDGSASAVLTVRLAGNWGGDPDADRDVVDVFAPYRQDSPLYGMPLLRTAFEFFTGFVTRTGPQMQRRFRGIVSKISPSSGDRSVVVEGVDRTAFLRSALTVPGTGIYASLLARYGPDAYRARINSQWLIDRALRRNGFYASPPPRDNAILSVTGHGSMIPEVGWGGAPQEYYPTYRGEMWQVGRFGALATVGGPVGRWWLQDQLTIAAGTGFGMSMWLGMFPANAAGAAGQYLVIHPTFGDTWLVNFGVQTNGQPYLGFLSANGESRIVPTGYTAPATGQFQFVGVHVAFGATSVTAKWRINGNDYTSTATLGARSGTDWATGPYMTYAWNVGMHNFQIWLSPTPPAAGGWQGEAWIPQVDLDPGTNELTGIPELNAVDCWELIKAVVAAEGSTFWFTEDGRPQFRTSKGDAWFQRTRPIVERITADRNLSDLASTTEETTIRNIINIKTKTQLISDWQDCYTSTDVAAFDSKPGFNYFEIEFPASVYEVPQAGSTYGSRNNQYERPNGASPGFIYYDTNELWSSGSRADDSQSYIRAMLVRRDASTQIAALGTVGIRLVRLTPWRLQVIIYNANSYWVRFATLNTSDSGSGEIQETARPAFIIPARMMIEGPEQVETYTDNTSVGIYGASNYDIGGDQDIWRQAPQGLRALAAEVLAVTANPVPVLDAIDVPHDPRRQLGQRVQLDDPDGLGSVVASIVGLSTTYSAAGAVDRITVRPLTAPG